MLLKRNQVILGAAAVILVLMVTGIGLLVRHFLSPSYTCNGLKVDTHNGRVLDPCATVSGRVIRVLPDGLGNLDVQLRPDEDSSYAVNYANNTGQSDNLLVKLPCAASAPRQTGFQGCAAYQQAVTKAWINNHLSYTGALIIDPDHDWTEMYALGQGS